MGHFPNPIREPLPVRRLIEYDIEDALRLTIRWLDDPEDPDFDPGLFGFVCAARAALIECAEVLAVSRAEVSS